MRLPAFSPLNVTRVPLRLSEARALGEEHAFRKHGIKLASDVCADLLIKEAQAPRDEAFDIFLSHSYSDQEAILRIKRRLQSLGYKVYVDWVEDDAELSRLSVSRKTAERLRLRIRNSRCLLLATSEHTDESFWIPWELGCADGHHGKVAILPYLREDATSSRFQRLEFLQLYPVVDEARLEGSTKRRLWGNRAGDEYVTFDDWRSGRRLQWRRIEE
ncbi:toll/interleukin-1 receptor domain-containing protein [Pyxidicoccus caerfyrddinensis]|uniref:toll/interleukin-1 receptor domain-containing protein n=1 Tax=Pyxidicoccus caerfyrddinensis TaxID=2709663 RepID=UPI0013DC6862|nr:toll/interleukin-1 receptor domain-containing protein [Pyxidicoccus caerfyrddinensis]